MFFNPPAGYQSRIGKAPWITEEGSEFLKEIIKPI